MTDFVASIASATLLEAAPDALLIADSHGAILAFNSHAPTLFGYQPEQFAALTVDQLLPAPDRARHEELRRSYGDAPSPRAMGFGLDLRAVRADDTTFPVDVSLAPITVAGTVHVIAAVRDISESVRLRDQMRRVTREAALVEERERVARDLHDTVIQEIFAVGLTLQSLSGRADSAVVKERLGQSIEDLDRVIRDIRTAIFGLTNHQAWGRGFQGEVLRIANEESHALGFEPAIDFVGDVDATDSVVAEQLLPSLREALSNVAKHADARRCSIVVAALDGHVELTVEDDGVGPGPQTAASPMDGRGLLNIRSRATELGGSFSLEAVAGGGARLSWRVPAAP